MQNGDTRIEQLADKLAHKEELIHKQMDEIRFLEAQCEEFLKKISEKETRIRDMEDNNDRLVAQLSRDN